MKTNKRSSRLLVSIFLALTLILGTIPTLGVMVVDNPETGDNPINYGSVGSLDNEGDVKIEKRAEKIGENKFEVKLTIEGKGKEEPETTDIVLVLDESGSMEGSKLTDVKSTAKDFVSGILALNSLNKVGLVSFSGYANIDKALSNDEPSLESKINALSAGGGTNIQDALRKADSAISGSNADNQYIVLLSDGAPTYSYKGTSATSSGAIVLGEDFELITFGSRIGDGSDYLLDNPYNVDGFTVENHGVATVSEALNINTTIYTIGFGLSSGADDISSSDAERVLKEIAKSSSRYFPAGNADDLINIFTSITTSTFAPIVGGIVTDPIGPMFTFVPGSIDVVSSHGSASYDSGDDEIVWNVGNVEEGDVAIMTYELTLNVDDPAFVDNMYYDMNGETILEYTDVDGEDASIEFLVPEGKGKRPDEEPWMGTIEVRKSFAGEYGDIEGISFTLVGPDEYSETQVTNSDGVVIFEGLFEGEYTLTELTPSGFVSSIESGMTINLPEDADEQDYMLIEVVNRMKEDPEPENPDVTIIKEISGSGEFIYSGFVFELIGQNDINYGPLTTDSEGKVVFPEVEPGIYEIREILTPQQEEFFIPEDDKDIMVKINSDNIFTFTNTLKVKPEDPDVTIQKEISGEGSFSLEGFAFELWDDGYKVYGPEVTNSEGKAIFESVKPGTYGLVEVLTTDQAEIFIPEFEKSITVKIDSDNQFTFINTVETEEWNGLIRVIKFVNDSRNSNPSLSGFEFILRKESSGEETLIETKTTDSSGILNFANLEEGEYKLYESDRGNFSEGISSAGLAISLNQETSEDGIFEVKVTNTRRYSRDDDDEDEPEDEEEPEEEPEVIIVPEPTPEVPPVIVAPEPVVEAIEEIVEEVPQATLPKTGSIDPMLFSGIGAALVGLGLFLNKKKED
ncbi:MAG: SpaA isopeptide-forming pilin-related protein [Gudongella sp.]|nr:SpaA isopeptide-forming pilin-related protein [Gudongella sp.]